MFKVEGYYFGDVDEFFTGEFIVKVLCMLEENVIIMVGYDGVVNVVSDMVKGGEFFGVMVVGVNVMSA